jgi:hypothetical protein
MAEMENWTEGVTMKMERWIRAIAGTFILLSLALGHFVHPYWFFFTAFVGLNLLQSAFTKWCLMEDILKKVGLAGPCACGKSAHNPEEETHNASYCKK